MRKRKNLAANIDLEIIDFDAEAEVKPTNPVKLRLALNEIYGFLLACVIIFGAIALYRIEDVNFGIAVFAALYGTLLIWISGVVTSLFYPKACHRIGKKLPQYDIDPLQIEIYLGAICAQCRNLSLVGFAGVAAFLILSGAIVIINFISLFTPEAWYISVALGAILSVGYALAFWISVICDLIQVHRAERAKEIKW